MSMSAMRSERPPNGLSLAIDLEPLVTQVVARLLPVLGEHIDERPHKRAFRIPEVAELLSLSVREVERLVADGEIDSIRVGRVRLIASSAIDAFLTQKHEDEDDE